MTDTSLSIVQITMNAWCSGRRTRRTSGGWISGNAVCCHHRGERADTRGRGGLRLTDDGVAWHCFNCGFSAAWSTGSSLSSRFRQLLEWLNVDERTVEMMTLEALRNRGIGELIQRERVVMPRFHSVSLPADARLITDSDTHYRDYLTARCVDSEYPFMCTPDDTGRDSERIIVPFTHGGQIVGHTSRYMDNREPRYISVSQPGYVFGMDLQSSAWQYAIVVEGIFDALSISGLALLHNDVNEQQAHLINSLKRDIIVVPDHDLPGLKLIDRAIELGWSVSVPDWPNNIKDTNDAVKHLGRAATLITILSSRETSRIKIEMTRKRLAKRLRN